MEDKKDQSVSEVGRETLLPTDQSETEFAHLILHLYINPNMPGSENLMMHVHPELFQIESHNGTEYVPQPQAINISLVFLVDILVLNTLTSIKYKTTPSNAIQENATRNK